MTPLRPSGPIATRIYQAAPHLEPVPLGAQDGGPGEHRATLAREAEDGHLCLVCGQPSFGSLVCRVTGPAPARPPDGYAGVVWVDLCLTHGLELFAEQPETP